MDASKQGTLNDILPFLLFLQLEYKSYGFKRKYMIILHKLIIYTLTVVFIS